MDKPKEIHVSDILQSSQFSVFTHAALMGHLDMINRVVDLAEQEGIELSEMLKAESFFAFRNALFNDHVNFDQAKIQWSVSSHTAWLIWNAKK